jgi:hypothetical protein
MSDSNTDPELNAIQSIIGVLEPLDVEARKRVTEYVARRLNLSFPTSSSNESARNLALMPQSLQSNPILNAIDIRTLKEQRKPSTANEMAALVAFYVAELAPIEERKSTIETSDIEKYFKQAAYPLPKVVSQTLQNALKSGYFETSGGGKYKLTPVGYNLVVHGLPSKVKK